MAIELMNKDIYIATPNNEPYYVHAHEIRLFDTDEEALEILTSKFVKVAINASEERAIIAARMPDNTFYVSCDENRKTIDMQFGLSLVDAMAWIEKWNATLGDTRN